MAISKKKIIKSLENLSGDLVELIHQQYPNGYQASISRITNAKKEPIFVFPLDTEEAISIQRRKMIWIKETMDLTDQTILILLAVTQMQIMTRRVEAARAVKPAMTRILILKIFLKP
jgi:hypothetical protein